MGGSKPAQRLIAQRGPNEERQRRRQGKRPPEPDPRTHHKSCFRRGRQRGNQSYATRELSSSGLRTGIDITSAALHVGLEQGIGEGHAPSFRGVDWIGGSDRVLLAGGPAHPVEQSAGLYGNVCVRGQFKQLRGEPNPAVIRRPPRVRRDGRVDLIHGGGVPIRHVRIRRHGESLQNQTKAKHVPALQKSFRCLLSNCSIRAVQQQQVQNSSGVVHLGVGRQAAPRSSPYRPGLRFGILERRAEIVEVGGSSHDPSLPQTAAA